MSYPNSDPFAPDPYTQNPYRAVGGQTFVGGPTNAILGMQRPFSYPNNNPRSVPGSSPGGAGSGSATMGLDTSIPRTRYGSPLPFNPVTNNFSAHYAMSGGLAAQAARGGGGSGMGGGGGGEGGGGMSWNTSPHDLEVQAERSAQRIGNHNGVMSPPSPQQNGGLGSNPGLGSTDAWWRLQGINPHGTPGPSVSHPNGSSTPSGAPGNGAGSSPSAPPAPPARNGPPGGDFPNPSLIHPGTLQSGDAQDLPDAGITAAAYGGTVMHRAIVGDPQSDGGPNPELVEAAGPIRVTPLRNMPRRQAHSSWARLPHYDQGGTTDSSVAPAPITSPLGDTNLSSDSIPPPAPPYFQDAAPLPGFNAMHLSPGPTPSYRLSDSTDFGENAHTSGFVSDDDWGDDDDSLPVPMAPLEFHTDRDSYLQPPDSGTSNKGSDSAFDPSWTGWDHADLDDAMPTLHSGSDDDASAGADSAASLPRGMTHNPADDLSTDPDSLLQPSADEDSSHQGASSGWSDWWRGLPDILGAVTDSLGGDSHSYQEVQAAAPPASTGVTPSISAMSGQVDDHYASHANEAGNKYRGPLPRGTKIVDCTTLGTDAIAAGYDAAGDPDFANKIRGMGRKSGFEIANELIKRGWTPYYYNPDKGNRRSGAPGHGVQPDYYQGVKDMDAGLGYGVWLKNAQGIKHRVAIDVDNKNHQMVNYDINVGDTAYATGSPPTTAAEQAMYDQMMKEPFAFIVGPGAIHNAILQKGEVTQIHWDHYDGDPDPRFHPLYEKGPFKEDWSRRWRDGVIMVPPKSGAPGS